MKNCRVICFLIQLKFSAILVLSTSSALAQNLPAIPKEWPINYQYDLLPRKELVEKHFKEYDLKIDKYNDKCGDGKIPANDDALKAFCAKWSDELDLESLALDKEKEEFMITFHDYERIYNAYVASKAFQQKEQEKFDKMNAEWKKEQKGLVQKRLQKPNAWSKGICDELQKNAPPLPYKKFNELESGDVILFSPNMEEDLTIDKITGKIINMADKIASGSKTSEASHAITYLKEENGKKLFLDNNPGQGPQIITEDALQLKYGDRKAQVAKLNNYGIAQPLNKEEAERLFKAAKEMEAKNIAAKKEKEKNLFDKTNYGISKENIVCSEASWLLLKSTGRTMPLSKSWIAQKVGIDFSPSDFYENTQYFLVTPLSLNNQKKPNE